MSTTAEVKKIKNLINWLNEQEWNIVLSHSRFINFTAQEIIIHQGKLIAGIYLIIDGCVAVAAHIMGRGIRDIKRLEAGEFLNEMSFIEGGPCPVTYTAAGNVETLFIDTNFFTMLGLYFPELSYKINLAIAKQVCGRLKIMHDKVTKLISETGMTSISFLLRVIQSLHQPKSFSLDDLEIDKATLKTGAFFGQFKPEEVSELLKHANLLEAPKNCKLIDEGEKAACCYLIVQGAVQSSIMQENTLAKLSVIGPQRLFANLACIDRNTPFTITFVSCESAILLKFDGKSLSYLQQHKPQIWYKLFSLICKSLVALQKSVHKLDLRLHIETYNR